MMLGQETLLMVIKNQARIFFNASVDRTRMRFLLLKTAKRLINNNPISVRFRLILIAFCVLNLKMDRLNILTV